MDLLNLIGRNTGLFDEDIIIHENTMREIIAGSRFLVIGGAGSIGQAVVKEIFRRNPRVLHVVDISENNMVELVRDIRSTMGYIDGDFKTFALDCGSLEYDAFIKSGVKYDYILNLSALKHVRSEKDPFTLMRMVDVNILNTIKTVKNAIDMHAEKYFCVSTDKAANPVNMMGASKRIMEMFLLDFGEHIDISTARFANVAFSDGSLLHGFNQRLSKRQPISAPHDVKRYFVTPGESGQLCLFSCLLGNNRDIFFPKLSKILHLIKFSDIAINYLKYNGYEPFLCSSEEEARQKAEELIQNNKWPCYFFASDTTGEKDFEEFYTKNEKLDLASYKSIGIVKNTHRADKGMLDKFLRDINRHQKNLYWTKEDIVSLFREVIPEFLHEEKNKNLDQRM